MPTDDNDEAQDDPRLEHQLDILKSRRLSQFAIAINGLRLAFWGEDAASIAREIFIEHPTISIALKNEPDTTHDWNHPVVATALLTCLDKTLTDITLTGGKLTLSFANGVVVTADPDDQYKSWQINSGDGLLVVCMPGGELAIWYPADR
ncbi:DUF6188 family protein [Sinomonas terrae]|uniref:DUF6188 family protein n=1 Tax=Sinomonas terrae TaxID=2908838 RepID=A0ABS9U3E2_9MICC|nr:DUF6188 family protein [Sinomonas terrae]MCH6471217.1 DUF6188 family protein [Sinomonas terrae]